MKGITTKLILGKKSLRIWKEGNHIVGYFMISPNWLAFYQDVDSKKLFYCPVWFMTSWYSDKLLVILKYMHWGRNALSSSLIWVNIMPDLLISSKDHLAALSQEYLKPKFIWIPSCISKVYRIGFKTLLTALLSLTRSVFCSVARAKMGKGVGLDRKAVLNKCWWMKSSFYLSPSFVPL